MHRRIVLGSFLILLTILLGAVSSGLASPSEPARGPSPPSGAAQPARSDLGVNGAHLADLQKTTSVNSEDEGTTADNSPMDGSQWGVGAYSESLGLSSYSGTWSQLSNSYSLSGVGFAAIILNVGYNATGTYTIDGVHFSVLGEFFQAAIFFDSSHTYSYPGSEIWLLL